MLRGVKRLAAAAPFLSLMGCDDSSGPGTPVTFSGTTMGTRYRVTVVGRDRGAGWRALQRDIDGILETVNERMSTYRPGSELSLFNAQPSAAWIDVSDATAQVVSGALKVSRVTGGAFDATVGPLVDLWGFGPARTSPVPPAGARIGDRLGSTGYENLAARTDRPAIRKSRPGLRVDLSGIAKGFAVDEVSAYLERAGAERYLAEIGGEIRVRGSAWRIGVERPLPGPRTVHRVVRLDDAAIATSGDYRIFFESGGVRYPHIIDPRSGIPVAHGLASVTVVAPTAMAADAWSTALMVLGPDDGMALARSENVAALFIGRTNSDFSDRHTPEFGQFVA